MNIEFFRITLLIPALVSLIIQPACSDENNINVVTPKKGIAAARFGPGNIAQAHSSWYYNWRSSPNSGTVPDGLQEPEYVPMLSRSGDVTDQNINRLKEAKNNGTYRYLLGFNEPDISSQANMSVSQAINLWPRLMETGLILGSPAPSWNNSWFSNFMSQAEANNLRVDFICLHFYRSPSANGVIEELENFLTDAYDDYQKPIWITEFGAPDCNKLGWCGAAPPLTQAITDEYTEQVIAMLEDLPFVERYAWFVDGSQYGFEFSAIFNSDGSLTRTGTVFRDAHGTLATLSGPSGRFVSTAPFIRQIDDLLFFRFPSQQANYSISILDMAGRSLFRLRGTGTGDVMINPAQEGLAKGAYIGKMETDGDSWQERFIVR